jgi:predicted Rossmann fold nucleotide-binding protein DprA/Smf involved in DNA uptake
MTAALQQTTARQRLTAIRNALALADDLLAQAYAARDWEALGHPSWEAYCAAEIPELRHLKLRAPERRARIQTLRNAAPGISVRELAAATGAAVGTVHADLAGPGDALVPRRGGPSGARTGVSTVARVLAALDRRPADVFTIARKTKLRQAQVSPALSRLAAAGRVAYTPPARRGGTGTYASVTA